MTEPDSVNNQPPFLGPQLPVYPALEEVLRLPAGVGALAGNVYLVWLQQLVSVSPLTLRDRIQVYLWEPNLIPLNAGYYVGRLMSNYNGLPLYTTFCCT